MSGPYAGNDHPDSTSFRWLHCGYNLSGSMVGGHCPECGTPIADSLRALQNDAPPSGNAIAGLVLGILSLTCCGLLGFVPLILHRQVKREVAEGRASSGSLIYSKIGMILGWVALGVLMLTLILMFLADL